MVRCSMKLNMEMPINAIIVNWWLADQMRAVGII